MYHDHGCLLCLTEKCLRKNLALCVYQQTEAARGWGYTKRPVLYSSSTFEPCLGSGFIDSGSGSSVLGWIPIRIWTQGQNLNKFTAEKNCNVFDKENAIYLSLDPHKGRPSYRRSLQPSIENSKHLKTWNFLTFLFFCGSFLLCWIRIRNTAFGKWLTRQIFLISCSSLPPNCSAADSSISRLDPLIFTCNKSSQKS